MNQERLILKGRMQELKMKRMALITSAAANIKAVKNILAAASVTPVAEIDLEAALVNLKEAAAQKRELIEVTAKIATIEAELE